MEEKRIIRGRGEERRGEERRGEERKGRGRKDNINAGIFDCAV
jgi:hypothetical protein